MIAMGQWKSSEDDVLCCISPETGEMDMMEPLTLNPVLPLILHPARDIPDISGRGLTPGSSIRVEDKFLKPAQPLNQPRLGNGGQIFAIAHGPGGQQQRIGQGRLTIELLGQD